MAILMNTVVSQQRTSIAQLLAVASKHSHAALAYDKVPVSPCKPATATVVVADRLRGTDGRLALRGSRESLGNVKPSIAGELKAMPSKHLVKQPAVGTNIPVTKAHLAYRFSGGAKGNAHPQLNPVEWRAAHSKDNLLQPTAAKWLCTACGMIKCKCQ